MKLSILNRKIVTVLTDSFRLIGFLRLAIIGLLAGLFISLPAWSTARTYPLSPIVEGLELSFVYQNLLLTVSVLSLLSALFNLHRRVSLCIAALSILSLVLLDITRLQPWVLHYLAIIFLFWTFTKNKHSDSALLDAGRIIIVGIYFWSGIHKLSQRFFAEIFPWFTEHLWSPFGASGLSIMLFIGLLVPFIEALFALGLLSRRFRVVSLIGATAMLLLVLSSLGPTGHGWNSSVWPWNLTIYGMTIIIFYRADFDLKQFFSRIRKSVLAWLMIFVFWIMPAGNFVGLTDHYLSWSLYSGKVPEAALFGDQLFLESLSGAAEHGELRFVRWAQQELNLVPYPENRVFQDIFETLCRNNPRETLLLVINNYSLTSSEPSFQKNFECNKLTPA